MKLINFGKEHQLGLKEIDAQHKEIFKSINHLYNIKSNNKNQILESLTTLLKQIQKHFDTEEKFMKENKVKSYISHKLEHDRAFRKYNDFYFNYKLKDIEFDPEILLSLKNWLLNHFEKKDIKLKEFAK